MLIDGKLIEPAPRSSAMQAGPVTGGEQFGFSVTTAAIDRADGVEDPLRGQRAGSRRPRCRSGRSRSGGGSRSTLHDGTPAR